jgi:hypothetical protein
MVQSSDARQRASGAERLLFDGPGGLRDPSATSESFLPQEVEAPAAEAMRELCGRAPGDGGSIAPGGSIARALTRYLAWAAARSLPMRQLFGDWARINGPIQERTTGIHVTIILLTQ